LTSGVYAILAQAQIGSITVSPTAPALKVGESAAFSALVKDEDGKTLIDRPIVWASSASDVVQIDPSTGAAQAKAPGSATVTATSEGKSASATVSVTPGAAANIAINAGDGQTADTSSAVATPPSVKVTDQAGFPVEGATVTFAVGVGGGSISPASVTTNASGIATADSWKLGNVAGSNSVTASIAGWPFVVFSATATQPAPPVPPSSPRRHRHRSGPVLVPPPLRFSQEMASRQLRSQGLQSIRQSK
jgi:Bacterial surface proteins containing Ig-like domains